jgi:hypothetical protein
MKLNDWLDALGLELQIKRYPNQKNRHSAWVALFNGKIEFASSADTKENASDPFLTGTFGNGTDPNSAVVDMIRKYKGKIIVVSPYKETRREHVFPDGIEL